MLYSSTRGGDNNKSFIEVLLNGLASDGGLYVPNSIPFFNKDKLHSFVNLEYHELCYEITKEFLNNEIPLDKYKKICEKTYEKFSDNEIISLTQLNKKEYILNLFHGPTFAFKDFALQLLGNIYEHILKEKKLNLTILGATSGDTGSAAIYGCSKSSKINLFILFPKGKVSEVQRKQMTTFDNPNVFNVEVNGNFDDCQRLVKKFFFENKNYYNLSAINSINWVRIMGQIVYYFWSFFKVEKNFKPINFVVPTGNFGNVYAGFYAKKMGLPIEKLIVASNKNDILSRFFSSGIMKIKKTSSSLSPSMDIQVSSNFERLLFYFLKDSKKIRKLFFDLDKKGYFQVKDEILKEILKYFSSDKLNDKDTISSISEIYKKFNIIIDPHTAVGYAVGKKILNNSSQRIYLATAHYGKFLETVKEATNQEIDYPQNLSKLLIKKENYHSIDNSIVELKNLIDSNS